MDIVIYILLGVIIVYLVFNLLIAWLFGKIIFSTPKCFAPSKEKVIKATSNLCKVDFADFKKWEKEFFTVKNGDYEIPCEYDRVQNAKGIAVVVHGFGQNRYMMVPHAKILRDLGYSTVLFDQRRFGVSTAEHGGFGYIERQDTAKVIDYIRERFGKDIKIVLIGCSMGAMSVLGSQLFTDSVDAIIEDSSPDRIVNSLAPFYSTLLPIPNPFLRRVIGAMSRKLGYDIEKNNPIDAAEIITCPVLIMHGEKDRTVPVQCAYEIKKVLKNPLSRIEIFPGYDHCLQIAETERYAQVVTEFLNNIQEV